MKLLTIIILCLPVLLSGCVGTPDNVKPVNNFELQRYLGKWYEIARLDHRFERGLSKISAQYSLREEGGVKVINRGYSEAEQQWREAEGKAYFVDDPSTAHLKVSFFGPFYGSYIVFDLDENYQYAMISGPDTDYLWILSRTSQLEQSTIDRLVNKAKTLGFNTDELIFVEH